MKSAWKWIVTGIFLIALVATVVRLRNSDDAPEPPSTSSGAISRKPPQPARPGKGARDDPGFRDDTNAEALVVPEEIATWLRRLRENPSGTIARILAMDDSYERDNLLNSLMGQWFDADRENMITWAEEELPKLDDENAKPVRSAILTAWSEREPQEALSWTRTHIPEEFLAEAERILAAAWGSSDPDGLADYVDDADPESLSPLWQEEAIHALIPHDPAAAISRAERIQNPDLRESALSAWSMSDPEGLEEWLTQHSGEEVEPDRSFDEMEEPEDP